MIDPTQQALLDGSNALASASGKAREWVTRLARSATSVGNEEHSLFEATLRAENLARKLAGSSGRRISAGVFGPSQAGKSYLVSVLGRNKDEPLMADFAGNAVNFIKELNPAGGKESTGLVTRFTIVSGTRDVQYPVELRLLTETDLVKLLGNSFLSDFDQHQRVLKLADDKSIRDVIARLEGQARGVALHLDEVRMFDIGEYFRANYPTSIGPLTSAGYWDALTRFGHKLPLPQRIELYSQLWGGTPEITRVFTLMQEALERLGHPANARVTMQALLPRERSIIDVDIVRLHLGTDADRTDLLVVVPELADGTDGRPVQVSRATLCALVAELKVVMNSQPWDFFDHTDLLDFPGARSREQMHALNIDAEKRADEVRNMVRRGKVSYLFQRYTEERELACMLLCMPPKPAEVKDLTGLVRFWVAQTHGDKPAARAQLPCALFFVLTMFDEELKAKDGDNDSAETARIDARLESSMFGLYKHEEWLQDWNGEPFCNTLFLRNPRFELEGVFEYEEGAMPRREIGIAARAAGRLGRISQGMLASEHCRKHFADSKRAWDEALSFNDGGVTYLVENLECVLSPTLKTNQLVGRLIDQAKVLDGRLRRFYQADDDASRKEKEDALLLLLQNLFEATSDSGYRNFVHFLSCMKLADGEVRAAFLNVGSLKKLDAAPSASAAASAAAPPPATKKPNPFGAPKAAAGSAPAVATTPVRQRDRYDQFAGEVINLWTERVRGLSTRTQTLTALGLDAALASDLANELVIGAHRNGLATQIAQRVRSQVASANLRWDEVADRCAGIAAMLVNDYVAYLGFAGLPVDKRPVFPEPPQPDGRPVFLAPPVPGKGDIPALGPHREALEDQYFLDWGVSLKQLGLDNINYAGGREIDAKDNLELGGILAEMAPALKVGAG